MPGSSHISKERLVLAAVYVAALGVMAVSVAASWAANKPLTVFLSDPIFTLGGHPLIGVQSQIGILFWTATAAICLFTSVLGYGGAIDRTAVRFSFFAGCITTVLLMDDLFQFHDDLAYSYLGIDEKAVISIYAAATLLFVITFRQVITSSRPMLLYAAGAFFGVSIGVDILLDGWDSQWRIFLEDAAKLLGIVSWGCYLSAYCVSLLRPPLGNRSAASK